MRLAIWFEVLRIKLVYPSVSVFSLETLPKRSGVYYAVQGFQVRYIGMASSLWMRWNGRRFEHHRKGELAVNPQTRIHYRLIGRHRLRYEEAREIQWLKPDLNIQRPNPSDYLSLQIRLELLLECIRDFMIAVLFALVILGVLELVQDRPMKSHPTQMMSWWGRSRDCLSECRQRAIPEMDQSITP